MSTTDIGTIKEANAGIGRTTGWIFALILTVVFAVSLIALTAPGTTAVRAPAAPAFSIGDQFAGGPATVNRNATPNAAAAWQPVVVNGVVCHQCR